MKVLKVDCPKCKKRQNAELIGVLINVFTQGGVLKAVCSFCKTECGKVFSEDI